MAQKGRPRKVSVKKLIDDIDAYIARADPPIVAEYAHMHNITREYLYQLAKKRKDEGNDDLSNAIKKLSEAKEIKLERGGLSGDYTTNMAIFSLKQLGWKDRAEKGKAETGSTDAAAGVIFIPAILDETNTITYTEAGADNEGDG